MDGDHQTHHDTVAEFLARHGLKQIIGVGGSAKVDAGDAPEKLHQQLRDLRSAQHRQAVFELVREFRGLPVAVACGGTAGGVPEMVVEAARECGVRCIGVMPQRGVKHAHAALDLRIVVAPAFGDESAWGDESPVLTRMVDAFAFVGGSSGTLTEFALVAKANEHRVGKGRLPILVAAVHGTGGLSDEIHRLPMTREVREHALPATQTRSGAAVAQFFLDRLFPA